MGKKNKPEPEFVACDGKIYFKPIEARDLKGGKKLTPFCKVYQDKEKKFESDVIMKTHDPAWGESARLIILDENVPIEKIRFVVMHKGTIMKDYIGELSFKITDLLDGVPRDDWFVLKNKKGSKNMGEIHLQIMYLDKSEDMSKQTDEFPYPLQTLLRKKSYKPWSKLIEQGCDIDKPDREGKTALHVCAELNLKEHLQTLLQRNADVAAKDNEERTALHVAAQYGSTECISVLLEMGAQINAKDKHAQTPLHIAAAGNQIAVATLLLDAGAGVSAQDENGDTPLHVALRAASNESVRLLIDRGADIYLENAKGQSSCTLSVVVGEENEAVRKCFFQAVNVVDAREFDLKRKYKHRTIVGGEGLKEYEHWLNDPQFAISGPKGADVHLVMHYDDPISKVTLPMEKNGFLLFRNYQKTNKELTYWYDNIKYGQVTPTELTIEEDDASYAVIVYSKMAKLSGKWFIVAYSDSEINVNPLVDWESVLTIDGKWEGASAGGSIGNPDTFTKNPKYKIALPAQTVRLYILLAQERNMGDVERFSIISYKFHIGFYIFKEDMTEPIQEEPIYKTAKFKNARENVLYVEIDGAKYPNVILIPATAKAGETSEFEFTIASDVKLAAPVQLESLPKMDEYEPSKKKTRKKKKSS